MNYLLSLGLGEVILILVTTLVLFIVVVFFIFEGISKIKDKKTKKKRR